MQFLIKFQEREFSGQNVGEFKRCKISAVDNVLAHFVTGNLPPPYTNLYVTMSSDKTQM